MNYKIIETGPDCPDVLIFRDRDEESEEIVKILAIGCSGDTEDLFYEEHITFQNADMAKQFVRIADLKFAEDFCKKYELTYNKR